MAHNKLNDGVDLDIVVEQRLVIVELDVIEDQTLLVNGNAFFIMHLLLDHLHSVETLEVDNN